MNTGPGPWPVTGKEGVTTMNAADDAPYTRREGDALARRVEMIDSHGTRGMQLIAAQVQAQAEAVGALRGELSTRFSEHTRQHADDARRRVTGRRWRIATGIAAVASLAAVLGLLLAIVEQVARLHG